MERWLRDSAPPGGMVGPMPTREVLPDGAIRYTTEGGALILTRVGPGVVLIALVGHDRGLFGDAPFGELAADIARHGTIEIFVDARAAANAAGDVAMQWGTWIQGHRDVLRRLSVLVSSKYLEFTAELVKFFSRVEHLVRVYTNGEAFRAAIAQASARPFELGPPRS